ncbi:MAG: TPM domain-containing protein [Spirochaetia bacterium]|nr:TPM domain-containing protein [Spirochaetia bacterium]
MKYITNEEKIEIQNAVKNAERKTSGEFVTIIAGKSESYFLFPIIWAAFGVLIAVIPLILVFTSKNAKIILDIQLLIFVVMYLVFQIESIKMLIVPKKIRRASVKKLAMEQFLERGIANTKDHSGVLFFVSMAERCVEIIADKGINDKVDKDAWQIIVDEFIENVHNQKMCNGFVTAVEKCGNLMSLHYPVQSDDKNELNDNLIEL